MVHTYKVTGMTCGGCKSHVQKTLQSVEGVKKAEVSLENGEAKIEMEKHIPLETFQKTLSKDGGNYQIQNK